MALAGRSALSLSALYNRIHVLSLAAHTFGDEFLARDVAQTGIEGLSRFDSVAGGDRWCARRDGRVPQAPPGSAGGIPMGGPARDKDGVGRGSAEDLRVRGQPLRGDARRDRGCAGRDLRRNVYLEG